MSAQSLARELRRAVVPVLDSDALEFIDVYFSEEEWEIFIGMAAQTCAAHGIPLNPEVSEYEEWISDSAIEAVRSNIRGQAA